MYFTEFCKIQNSNAEDETHKLFLLYNNFYAYYIHLT